MLGTLPSGNQLFPLVCSASLLHHLAVSEFVCCARASGVCSGVSLKFALLCFALRSCCFYESFPSQSCFDAANSPDAGGWMKPLSARAKLSFTKMSGQMNGLSAPNVCCSTHYKI